MSHHEMLVDAVMQDRMREAAAARQRRQHRQRRPRRRRIRMLHRVPPATHPRSA